MILISSHFNSVLGIGWVVEKVLSRSESIISYRYQHRLILSPNKPTQGTAQMACKSYSYNIMDEFLLPSISNIVTAGGRITWWLICGCEAMINKCCDILPSRPINTPTNIGVALHGVRPSNSTCANFPWSLPDVPTRVAASIRISSEARRHREFAQGWGTDCSSV